MKLVKREVLVRGRDVLVEQIEDVAGAQPAKKFRACCGAKVVEGTLTFGAADGPRPEVSAAQLQADVDAFLDGLAREAAWQAELAQALEEVK